DAPTLPARPQSVCDRLAGKIDDRIDRGCAVDLVETCHQPERWAQRGSFERIARQHDDIVSGGGERLGQAAPDEPGRARDQHPLAAWQSLDQLGRGRRRRGKASTRSGPPAGTSRSMRRAAKPSRRPNTATPKAASVTSTVANPYQAGTSVLGSPAHASSTGVRRTRIAP